MLKREVAGAFHTTVISAYAERAIEAFKHGALDFIANPFTKRRLGKAMARFDASASQQDTKYLAVRCAGQIVTLAIDEVMFFLWANIYAGLSLQSGNNSEILLEQDVRLPDGRSKISELKSRFI
ncbi:hypothetical protein P2G88_10280 [Aliiglaciecola sp. CAU 1673]|uniref:hypothetical protein n=1 Tax=Aliiglaciecola sp. CAU 1673 TaxID=3032595 RepID=UPI0023DBD70C|nr:hypothetical protein [Aliiglaciecola sp. CAU 1673]MDF2178635.1 hypothetical protein [Aliiglaciecola sp. CAU 1673]